MHSLLRLHSGDGMSFPRVDRVIDNACRNVDSIRFAAIPAAKHTTPDGVQLPQRHP